jgi:hypothetical protein
MLRASLLLESLLATVMIGTIVGISLGFVFDSLWRPEVLNERRALDQLYNLEHEIRQSSVESNFSRNDERFTYDQLWTDRGFGCREVTLTARDMKGRVMAGHKFIVQLKK